MNKRLLIVLLVAAVVSGGASFILYRLLAGRSNDTQTNTIQVLVATKTMKVGTLIKEDDVRLADWPGTVPSGSFSNPKDVVGRGVLSTVVAGEPVLEARLAAKGAGGGLAATIPPGKRAVAIRVNDVTSLAGFAVPGMHVDVLVSASPPREALDEGEQRVIGNGSITRTVLQNVEVLSAGTNIEPNTEGKPIAVTVINLLVTPAEAEVLSLASNEGKIQLVLRNPTDDKVVQTSGTAMARLLLPEVVAKPPAPKPDPKAPSGRAPARTVVRWLPAARSAPKPPEPPPFTVEVIHGNKKTETAFDPLQGGSH